MEKPIKPQYSARLVADIGMFRIPMKARLIAQEGLLDVYMAKHPRCKQPNIVVIFGPEEDNTHSYSLYRESDWPEAVQQTKNRLLALAKLE